MPQASAVLLTDLIAQFTPEQVEAILANSNNIPVRYDKAHRLIVRLPIDESNLKELSRTPSAHVFWKRNLASGKTQSHEQGVTPVPVDPVQY